MEDVPCAPSPDESSRLRPAVVSASVFGRVLSTEDAELASAPSKCLVL